MACSTDASPEQAATNDCELLRCLCMAWTAVHEREAMVEQPPGSNRAAAHGPDPAGTVEELSTETSSTARPSAPTRSASPGNDASSPLSGSCAKEVLIAFSF